MVGELVISDAERTDIEKIWGERWGIPIVTPFGMHYPLDVRGIAVRVADGLAGLITWRNDKQTAEIISLDSLLAGRGVGSMLLQAAETLLAGEGIRLIRTVTTNDNVRAFRFFTLRGYRLVRVYLDGVQRVREMKPNMALTGLDGIPLRDLWELEKPLR